MCFRVYNLQQLGALEILRRFVTGIFFGEPTGEREANIRTFPLWFNFRAFFLMDSVRRNQPSRLVLLVGVIFGAICFYDPHKTGQLETETQDICF